MCKYFDGHGYIHTNMFTYHASTDAPALAVHALAPG